MRALSGSIILLAAACFSCSTHKSQLTNPCTVDVYDKGFSVYPIAAGILQYKESIDRFIAESQDGVLMYNWHQGLKHGSLLIAEKHEGGWKYITITNSGRAEKPLKENVYAPIEGLLQKINVENYIQDCSPGSSDADMFYIVLKRGGKVTTEYFSLDSTPFVTQSVNENYGLFKQLIEMVYKIKYKGV